jgi:hypothetical protein
VLAESVEEIADDGLKVIILVPPHRGSEVTQAEITSTDGSTPPVSFPFEFSPPRPSASPIDGPSTGGTLVTVVAFWDRIQISADDVSANVLGTPIEVVNLVASSVESTVLVLRMPPCPLAATDKPSVTFQVDIQGRGEVSGEFSFEYFVAPKIEWIRPPQATLLGNTLSACSRCLPRDNGKTVSVLVTGLPAVSSPSDLMVTFDGVLCGQEQGARTCVIWDVTTFTDGLQVRVTAIHPSIVSIWRKIS